VAGREVGRAGILGRAWPGAVRGVRRGRVGRRRLAAVAWNGQHRGELELSDRIASAEQAREQPRRQRRWPAPTALGVPDCAGTPHEGAEHDKGGAVDVAAALAAACPCEPPRAQTGDASKGRSEASADPRDHREEAKDSDQAGKRTSRCGRSQDVTEHAVPCTSCLGRFSGGPRSRRAPRRLSGRVPGAPCRWVDGLRRATARRRARRTGGSRSARRTARLAGTGRQHGRCRRPRRAGAGRSGRARAGWRRASGRDQMERAWSGCGRAWRG
jgi:hypothetical protein